MIIAVGTVNVPECVVIRVLEFDPVFTAMGAIVVYESVIVGIMQTDTGSVTRRTATAVVAGQVIILCFVKTDCTEVRG